MAAELKRMRRVRLTAAIVAFGVFFRAFGAGVRVD
jgi:hypothetical protein